MQLPPKLILYFRHGCPLCEDFELALGEFLIDIESNIDVVIRDVDSQSNWRERYNESVPILFHQKDDECQEVCRYYFEPPTLNKHLNDEC